MLSRDGRAPCRHPQKRKIVRTPPSPLTRLCPRRKRLSLGSGTDVKSRATFSSGPDPSERPRRNDPSLLAPPASNNPSGAPDFIHLYDIPPPPLSADCRFSSFIKRYPVRPVFVGRRSFAFRKSLYYFPIFITIPRIVPTTTHIQIKRMLHLECYQILYKVLVCHNLLGFNDTQFPVLLAQGSINGPVLPHFGANRSRFSIMNNQ